MCCSAPRTLSALLPPCTPQDPVIGKPAKALSRDECEAALQQLALAGVLRLDFAFTAYQTIAYLKLGARAPALLQVGGAAPGGAAGRAGLGGRCRGGCAKQAHLPPAS